MTVTQPVCLDCKHWHGKTDPLTCDAFRVRIPDIVWLDNDPHTARIPGDHGIRFEAKDGIPRDHQH